MKSRILIILKSAIFVLFILTVCLGGGYLWLTWNTPLGPALEPVHPTATLASIQPARTQNIRTPVPTGTPTLSLTPTIVPICGGPPSMTILLSGVASEGYLYGLADAIRVVSLDFQNQTISVLAFPRDTWVDIPDIADHGVSQGKLNQAYFYGTEGMGYFDGSGYGSGLLAKTLQENFGMQIDHYLAVNLHAFRNIVDTMGGVDVYFSQPVHIKKFEKPKLYLQAGQHHLSGKEAENVVRTRIEIGDLGRIENQTVVLKAVAAKLITPSGIQNIPTLIRQVQNSVLTDLSPAEINQLICLAEKIDPKNNIDFHEIPEDLLREDRVYDSFLGYNPYVLLIDEAEMRRIVADFLNGRS